MEGWAELAGARDERVGAVERRREEHLGLHGEGVGEPEPEEIRAHLVLAVARVKHLGRHVHPRCVRERRPLPPDDDHDVDGPRQQHRAQVHRHPPLLRPTPPRPRTQRHMAGSRAHAPRCAPCRRRKDYERRALGGPGVERRGAHVGDPCS